MIHVLDYQTDKVLDWLDNSENKIFWGDKHSINLKENKEKFDFIMPSNVPAAEHFSKQNRVIIPDEDGYLREFIITEVYQTSKEKEMYTSASYLELNKLKIIDPIVLQGQTVNTSLDFALDLTGWERGETEYAGTRTLTFDTHTRGLDALRYIASQFGLELRFRIVKKSGRVIGRYVDLINRVGVESKKEIELGKDLIGVKRREVSSNLITGLIGLGQEQSDGTRLIVRVEDKDALQRWGKDGRHLWDIYEPTSLDENLNDQILRDLTRVELDKRINTTVEYEADAASIEHIFGYEHEKVRIGDTNRIKDTSWVPPLYLDARIISVERSISDPSQKTFVLGDFIEYKEEDVMKAFRLLKTLVAQKAAAEDIQAVKEYVDQQDSSLFDDATYYADQVSATAEEEAKKYADGLKTSVDGDITALKSQVNSLDTYVDGSFKDGLVSEAEAKAIKQHLNSLSVEKGDVDSRFLVVYYNPHLAGTEKADLLSKKGSFDTAYTNLVNSINATISDGKATSTEVSDVNSKFTAYNIAIQNVATSFENAIDKIAQDKANTAESRAKEYADTLKKSIDGDIASVRTDLTELDNYVDGSFQDSVISQAEAKSIEKYINSLSTEKSDLDTRYTEIYNNTSLSTLSKINLSSAKSAYDTSHNNLISAINAAIADGKTMPSEKSNVDVKFADYKSKLSSLGKRFEEAVDNIAQAKVDAVKNIALVDRGNVPYGDWNSIKTIGIYRVGNLDPSTPNFPGGTYNYGTLKVEKSGGTSITQTYTPHRMENLTGAWMRITWDGTDSQWSQWKTIETAAASQAKADKAKSDAISAASTDATNKANAIKDYYSYVDTWKATGTTEIDGGRIKTQSIFAKQMMLADFTNLCENPDFELDAINSVPRGYSVATDGVKVADCSGWANGNGSSRCLAFPAHSDRNVDIYGENLIPVTEGQKFYLEGEGRFSTTAGNGIGAVGFRTYDKKRQAINSWHKVAQWIDKPTSFTKRDGVFTVPSGVGYLRIFLTFTNNGETTNSFYLDNIRIHRMSSAELIVDGAITAEKLSVTKLSAITSDLGIVEAGKLIAVDIEGAYITGMHGDFSQLSGTEFFSTNVRSKLVDLRNEYGLSNLLLSTGYVTGASGGTWYNTGEVRISGESDSTNTRKLIVEHSSGTSGGLLIDIGGSLQTSGNVYFGGTDLRLNRGDSSRGNTGESRALVKGVGGKLIINYASDFYGGVEIGGNVTTIGSAKVDTTGGTPRWSKDNSNYIYQSSDKIMFYQGGSVRHVFNLDGTKSGGSVEVDGRNLGMSPIDSPQVLLEYIEFAVPLSEQGTKIFIDETYLKTVEHWAAFPNVGEIIEKGIDYIIVKGTGNADIRIIGERIGFKGIFYADLDQFTEEDITNELLVNQVS
ncbi:phage tail spike protein [Rossellomorea sp. DA94]|uniref:phage tail spike protein n=1 Tax=Rossellomorea sp. DA94 TaxID=3038653 RepID=UPI00244881F0|nr:phage tail spike protein [Rossellomorea sp. DA94]WGG47690.1 phage tail spike protein [Rossellomorea sp. DA94]